MRSLKYQSRRGWFFLSANGDIYRLHLSLGGFSVAWEQAAETRRDRLARKRRQVDHGPV